MNLPPCFCPENSPTLNLAFQVGDGWFTARGVRFEVEAYTHAGPSARDSVQGDWPAGARPWRATHSVPMTSATLKPSGAIVEPPLSRIQHYIWNQERAWADRISHFLFGKILKVGNGLGYLTKFLQDAGIDVVTLDISESSAAVNRGAALLYDGEVFPFKDEAFSCVVFAFVLHHTPNPLRLLQEAYRVGSRIVVLEETYDSIFSKVDLVTRDIYVNWLANQDAPIFWESYFRSGALERYFAQNGRRVVHYYAEPKRTYWKKLYVVEPHAEPLTASVVG